MQGQDHRTQGKGPVGHSNFTRSNSAAANPGSSRPSQSGSRGGDRGSAGGAGGRGSNPNWSMGERSLSNPLPSRPTAREVRADPKDDYGIIISIKDSFGFLQPFLKEEQLYFSLRDVRYEPVVGDIVSFRERSSARGLNAEFVRLVPKDSPVMLPGVVGGTVLREPDIMRRVPGLLQVTKCTIDPSSHAIPMPAQIPFTPATEDSASSPSPSSSSAATPASPSRSNSSSSSSSSSSRAPRRMLKGDELQVLVHHLPMSNYFFGSDAVVVKTKKELQLAVQVERMLNAGAVQEVGVVDTIRGDYGFLKPQDQRDQVYFRLSDAIDQETPLAEGMEVSFFIILENSKGNLSDRAVHLQVIPKGTVKFESTIAQSVLGTVVKEPTNKSSREIPGKIRLHVPLVVTANSGRTVVASADGASDTGLLSEIELWDRCVPESLVLAVGDVLAVDVTIFRPEKLYFARNVRVKSYRKIGRELGAVCSVRGQGFGFVSSHLREHDLYFRTSEVIGLEGSLMKDRDVVEGVPVSFEVMVDESARGAAGARFKATRVQVIDSSGSGSAGVGAGVVAGVGVGVEGVTFPVATGIVGCVIKEAKKDAPGSIKVTSDLSHINIGEVTCSPAVVAALEEFESLAELKEISIEHVPTGQRKVIHQVLDLKFPHICHESAEVASSSKENGAKLVTLRLWKAETDIEREAWAQGRAVKGNPSAAMRQFSLGPVFYLKSDTKEQEFGQVVKDLEVQFDLHLDYKTSKLVAKNVALTDLPYESVDLPTVGVIADVAGKATRFGFIRSIPLNQKLFWHESGLSSMFKRPSRASREASADASTATAAANGADAAAGADSGSGAGGGGGTVDLVTGLEVVFRVRLRGGIPCATGVQPLPVGALSKEEVLEGDCEAVVVSDTSVVLLDTSNTPLLRRLYWNGDSNSVTDIKPKRGVAVEDSAAAATATTTATMPTDLSNSVEEVRKLKYFVLLNRSSIPISGSTAGLKLGDVVTCRAVVNWAVQREPLYVQDVSVLTSASPTVLAVRKSTGAIVRLKIQHRGRSFDRLAEMSPDASFLELCEIRETIRGEPLGGSAVLSGAAAAALGGGAYFTDIRDVAKTTTSTSTPASSPAVFSPTSMGAAAGGESAPQPGLQLGEMVEFLAVDLTDSRTLAVAVSLTPKNMPSAAELGGISFRRNVNAPLKEALVKKGFKGISMAQGPPDGGTIVGFAAGWREQPAVAALPWAHLLTHL